MYPSEIYPQFKQASAMWHTLAGGVVSGASQAAAQHALTPAPAVELNLGDVRHVHPARRERVLTAYAAYQRELMEAMREPKTAGLRGRCTGCGTTMHWTPGLAPGSFDQGLCAQCAKKAKTKKAGQVGRCSAQEDPHGVLLAQEMVREFIHRNKQAGHAADEDAIEQAYWDFDGERKRSGAERDAFKRQLRAHARPVVLATHPQARDAVDGVRDAGWTLAQPGEEHASRAALTTDLHPDALRALVGDPACGGRPFQAYLAHKAATMRELVNGDGLAHMLERCQRCTCDLGDCECPGGPVKAAARKDYALLLARLNARRRGLPEPPLKQAGKAEGDKNWKTMPGVRAVVVDSDNKVLLLRRPDDEEFHPGKWNLPGGAKEDNETFLNGALRELKEETGIGGYPTSVAHTFKFPGNIGKAFLMEWKKGKLKVAPREVAEVGWFHKDHLPKKLFPQTKSIINSLVKEEKRAHELHALYKAAGLLPAKHP